MAAAEDRGALAFRAAYLYYIQDLTMEAIAADLETSRSTVSRLLNQAKELGIVNITLRNPMDLAQSAAAEIKRRYKIAVRIVPVPESASDVERLEQVATATARMITDYFHPNMSLGIAWGSTLTEASRRLLPDRVPNSRIVQLNGAGNNRTTGIDYASEILRRFGEAFGSSVEQFPVPAFFDDPKTKEAMWQERSIKRVLALQASIDVALFSVGSPQSAVPSHVYMGGYLNADDYASLNQDQVVGDVATVFYRADGSSDGVALNSRATGPSFAVLRHAARRVCVVGSVNKVASLKGALAAKLITDLIIDEKSAQALVAAS